VIRLCVSLERSAWAPRTMAASFRHPEHPG
jgi:hypothetical protein